MTTPPAGYTFHVDASLADHWSPWLDHLQVTRHGNGTTTLAGPIADQAQLHGILDRFRDIGVTLLSVQADGPPDAYAGHTRRAALDEPIHTPRLLLRAGRADDADATYEYRRQEAVAHWLTSLPTDRQSYRTVFTDPDRLAATVIVECEGVIVGDLMLRVEDAWAQTEVADQARGQQAELGWTLHPNHTGQGYATEALLALLHHCFNDVGVRRVTANAFADNHASRRLMERVGMRLETHTVRESLHRSGEWLDGVAYALLADEWSTREPAPGRNETR